MKTIVCTVGKAIAVATLFAATVVGIGAFVLTQAPKIERKKNHG